MSQKHIDEFEMDKADYVSSYNINHEHIYYEVERLKQENFHLRRQLAHKQNINRGQSRIIAAQNKKLKRYNEEEQHYRNGQKRGKRGRNG